MYSRARTRKQAWKGSATDERRNEKVYTETEDQYGMRGGSAKDSRKRRVDDSRRKEKQVACISASSQTKARSMGKKFEGPDEAKPKNEHARCARNEGASLEEGTAVGRLRPTDLRVHLLKACIADFVGITKYRKWNNENQGGRKAWGERP
jgi:hypothetical protein